MKVITIGRNRDNIICVNDPQVSRHHCQIVQYDNGTFAIVDMNSTNGTYVNGIRVQGQTPLKRGDRVNLASIEINWQPYFPSTVKTNTKVWIWPTVATAIALSILTTVLLLVMRAWNINSGEILYSGPEPPIRTVTLVDNGVSYDVEAAEGQVIVMFDETVSHKEAVKILKKNKAKVIAQMPDVHYYLVEVPAGSESELISKLKQISKVNYVYPNAIKVLCLVSSHVIDNFNGDHGKMVSSMMNGCTPLVDVANHNVGHGTRYINSDKANQELKKIVENLKNDESAVINMSFGPKYSSREAFRNIFIEELRGFVNIAKSYGDKDFIIVKSSGNGGIKNLDKDLDVLMNDSLSVDERTVLERHFILVSAKDDNKNTNKYGDYPNDVSPGRYNKMVTKVDISDMTVQDLHWQGTSFSSPRAAGFIVSAANKYNMKVTEVLDYARKATEKTPDHVLTQELLEKNIIEHKDVNIKVYNDDFNETYSQQKKKSNLPENVYKLPCNIKLFDNRNSGQIKLPNGDIINYQYRNGCDSELRYSYGKCQYIRFSLANQESILQKYCICAKQSLDADTIWTGSSTPWDEILSIKPIDLPVYGERFQYFESDSIYIIIITQKHTL